MKFTKKFIFLFLTWFSVLSVCKAQQVQQEWVRTYDNSYHLNDYVGGVTIDKSENVYVAGVSFYNGPDSITLIKYSPTGTQQWVVKYYIDSNYATVIKVVTDENNNLYITGYNGNPSTGIFYIYLIKYNSNGVLQWFKRYGDGIGGYEPTDEIVDKLGNIYIIAGGILIFKYNSNGDTLWTRSFQQTGYQRNLSYSIAIDSTNNLIIAGSCIINQSTQDDCLLIKYSSSGNFIWSTVYNSGGYFSQDVFKKVGLDVNGNIYATGWGGINYPDCLTIKYNSSGTQQWLRRYRSPVNNSSNAGLSLALDKQNNVFLIADCSGPQSIEDFVTIKYNSIGDSLWVRTYDNPSHLNDIPYNIVLDSLSNVYISGRSTETSGYFITTIKYNSNGVQQWNIQYTGIAEPVPSLILDNLLNVYVIGNFSGYLSDFVTIKYNQPVGINLISNSVPTKYILNQNYPNPFNNETILAYNLPKKSFVKLYLYDILGRIVDKLIDNEQNTGNYSIRWNASSFPSGIYFCKMEATGREKYFKNTIKLLLIK